MPGGKLTRYGSKRTYKNKKKQTTDKRQDKAISTLFRRTSQEKKWIDQTSNLVVNSNYTVMLPRPLTYITQGDNNDQRIGNKVNVHSINIKGFITVNDSTNVVRILVVRYGRVDPSTIDLGEVLDNISFPNPQHLLAMKVRNGKQPYKILKDRTYTLAGNTTANSSSGCCTQFKVNMFINLSKTAAVTYSSDTDTTPSNGYIYIVAASDSALSGPVLNLHSRMIFTG